METEHIPTRLSRVVFAALCSMIVLTVVPYGTVHPPIIGIFHVLIALVAVLAIADALFRGEARIAISPLQVPIIAAVVYAFVQIIPFGYSGEGAGLTGIPNTISRDPYWTLVFAMHLIALGLFLHLAIHSLDSARRINKAVILVIGFGFVFAFFSIIQSFLSPERIYGVYEVAFAKPFGTFVNRHNFAAYMEMTIALPLGLLFQGAVKKDKRLLLLTAVALMAVAVLMSGSRGGLFAIGAQVLLLLLLSRGRIVRGRLWLKAVLALLLVAVVVLGAALIGGETSMNRLSETASSDDFSTRRAQIWSVTFDVIKDNLPLGAGFGAFGVAYTPHDMQSGLERVEQAHNDYLQVLADAGVMGAVIGIGFLFALYRAAREVLAVENLFRRGVGIGALVGIFGVLVHSLFDFVLHTTAVSILFLFLLALLRVSRDRYPDDFAEAQRPPSDPTWGSVSRIEDMKRVN